MTRCFVSHAHEDQDFVEQEITPFLTATKLIAWYSPQSIQTGAHWPSEVEIGLQSCQHFLVVLSPHSVRSLEVRKEVAWAVKNCRQITPLLKEDCNFKDLHSGLSTINQIDFRDRLKGRPALVSHLTDLLQGAYGRGKAVEGRWVGRVEQNAFGPDKKPLEYDVVFDLKVGHQISGSMRVDLPAWVAEMYHRTAFEFEVTGGLLYQRYVRLNYQNRDSRVIQFGSLLAEVDDQGRDLSGPFVGYGALSNRIISGFMRTKRPDSSGS